MWYKSSSNFGYTPSIVKKEREEHHISCAIYKHQYLLKYSLSKSQYLVSLRNGIVKLPSATGVLEIGTDGTSRRSLEGSDLRDDVLGSEDEDSD